MTVVSKPRKRAPKAPPVPRATRKQDTREKIRAAAYELFTTVGFDETTTKAVASKAGVASGTVFVHAADKTDLLCLVMHDRISGVVEAQLSTLPRGQPLLEQALHLFRSLFRMYGEHPKLSAAFVARFSSAKGPNGQQVGALTFTFLGQLAQLVIDAQGRGEVSADVDPLTAAQNFFALYFFALIAWTGGFASAEDAVEQHLRAALALQLRGLRP